jgi:muramidase (phage lysozyme)
MADKELLDRIDKLSKDPKVRAMLTAIGHSEGAGDNYNVHFGGETFSDMTKHPGASTASIVLRNGARLYPTAAGRYQILKSTWERDAKDLGLKDFSRESQDKAAIYELLKSGAIDRLENNDVKGAFTAANKVWASLPGSTLGKEYNGKTREMQWVTDVYDRALKNSGTSQTPQLTQQGSFLQQALGRLGYGQNTSFLNNALANYKNKTYANVGTVPFNMYTGNKLVASANPQLTPETIAELRAKLLNKDPNVQYGISFVGSSLTPTEVVTDDKGNTKGYFEVNDSDSVTGAPPTHPPLGGGASVTEPVLPPDVDLLHNTNTTVQPSIQQPAPAPTAYNYSGVTTQVDPLQVLSLSGDPLVDNLKQKLKSLA